MKKFIVYNNNLLLKSTNLIAKSYKHFLLKKHWPPKNVLNENSRIVVKKWLFFYNNKNSLHALPTQRKPNLSQQIRISLTISRRMYDEDLFEILFYPLNITYYTYYYFLLPETKNQCKLVNKYLRFSIFCYRTEWLYLYLLQGCWA